MTRKLKAEILRAEIARLKGLVQEYAEDEAHALANARALDNQRGYEHPAQRRAAALRFRTQAARSHDAAVTYAALAASLEAMLANAEPEVRTFWAAELGRNVCIPQ
jgi:hypothetical protein